MPYDEIIEELWEVKDSMAREYDNDAWKLGAYLQGLYSPDHTYGVPGRIFKTDAELAAYIKDNRKSLEH